MNKLRTVAQLQAKLDDEYAWRIKEISYLKAAVHERDSASQITIIRAAVAILYAHWEGFVKNTSQCYLNFVSNASLTYDQLQPCFMAWAIKKHLSPFVANDHTKAVEAVKVFQAISSSKPTSLYNCNISTKSNLNSEVFSSIARSIGLNPDRYATKFVLIDESLLLRRNKIAHGQELDLAEHSYTQLSDEVAALIRQYKDDLENACTLQAYKR